MVAVIEIVSKEMIKPSSPTPHQLQNHKLFFLDQLAPPIYVPLVFFYSAESTCSNTTRAEKSQQLKQSLSNTLTRFYPIAGRITRNLSVDCNDDGVEYVEAHVHARLANVIEEPSIEELIKQYLPKKSHEMYGDIPLAVQINFFDCGGIAIGACISHEIADGTAFVTFMNAWAATCRGDPEVVQPSFDLACIPPRDLSSTSFTPELILTGEKLVTKRFVFNKEKLSTLKEVVASASGSKVKDPTRVEVVSAFFWRHFIERAEAKSKMDNKMFVAYQAVNLRPRMSPSLPEHAFGNIFAVADAYTPPEADKGYHNLVGSLRDAVRNMNNKHMNKMQEGEYLLNFFNEAAELYRNKDIGICSFSSWSRFPVYEVDFGWGKPIWVSTSTMPVKNSVILMSTRCRQGIEAWVNTLEDDVLMLPSDL